MNCLQTNSRSSTLGERWDTSVPYLLGDSLGKTHSQWTSSYSVIHWIKPVCWYFQMNSINALQNTMHTTTCDLDYIFFPNKSVLNLIDRC